MGPGRLGRVTFAPGFAAPPGPIGNNPANRILQTVMGTEQFLTATILQAPAAASLASTPVDGPLGVAGFGALELVSFQQVYEGGQNLVNGITGGGSSEVAGMPTWFHF